MTVRISLNRVDMNGVQMRWSKGADVASATTLTLGNDGNYFDITGTTTITSIRAITIGTVVRLHFDSTLTLTHHSTDLILPGAANITTATGDNATFVEYATGDWRCTNYQVAATAPGAGGGAWTLISSVTASASASVDFTSGINSTYDTYIVLGEGIVPATDDKEMRFRTSTDGGSNFDSGASEYQWINVETESATSVATGDVGQIQLHSAGLGNAAGESLSFTLYLRNPSNSSLQTLIDGHSVLIRATGALRHCNFSGKRASAADVNAIRFIFSSGNITSGTFSLYGISKS